MNGIDVVGRIGLGCSRLAIEDGPSREAAVRVIHHALDAGIRLLDTARSYGVPPDGDGAGEELVRDALRRWHGPRDDVLVATKGGQRHPARDTWVASGRPETIVADCKASLDALGVDCIDLYYLHTPDPAVPFEESLGALTELRTAGLVQNLGVSNVSADQLRAAVAMANVVAVQNLLGPSYVPADVVQTAAELGITFVAYSPLTGVRTPAERAERPAFDEIARRRGLSPARVALAWVLARGPHVVALSGCMHEAEVDDNVPAADLALTAAELKLLGEA